MTFSRPQGTTGQTNESAMRGRIRILYLLTFFALLRLIKIVTTGQLPSDVPRVPASEQQSGKVTEATTTEAETTDQQSLEQAFLDLVVNSTVSEKKAYCDERVPLWDEQLEKQDSLTPLECLRMKLACGVSSCEASIDLVYTWVNGSEPSFFAKKNATVIAMQESGKELYSKNAWNNGASAGRFRDFEVLKHSLRSVDLNAPWARRIFLVTDDQTPSFLDPSSSLRLRMISHQDLFSFVDAVKTPPNYPLYNSKAIISMIHSIPTVSSPFMLMDDDFLFGRAVPKSHLYDEVQGKYILRLKAKPFHPNRHHMWITSIWNTVQMFAKKHPNDTQASTYLSEKKIQCHEHGPILLFPQDGFQMWEDLPEVFLAELDRPFRHQDSFQVQTMYRLFAGDRYKTMISVEAVDFQMFQLKDRTWKRDIDKFVTMNPKPYTLCMNDDFESSDTAFLQRATDYIQNGLATVFAKRAIVN
jgi:hypothetical protein